MSTIKNPLEKLTARMIKHARHCWLALSRHIVYFSKIKKLFNKLEITKQMLANSAMNDNRISSFKSLINRKSYVRFCFHKEVVFLNAVEKTNDVTDVILL